MNASQFVTALFLSVAFLLPARPAAAHRLDELLQAARISVQPDHVRIELDLTPGAAVTPDLIAVIDTDNDGKISAAEGEAYGQAVLGSTVLLVDEKPQRVRLVSSLFPAIAELNEGVGIVRIQGIAEAPAAAGRHRLLFANRHEPVISVYLANALVPASRRIAIAEQQRDFQQHELRFDYFVSPVTAPSWQVALWCLLPFALAAFVRLWHKPVKPTGTSSCHGVGIRVITDRPEAAAGGELPHGQFAPE